MSTKDTERDLSNEEVLQVTGSDYYILVYVPATAKLEGHRVPYSGLGSFFSNLPGIPVAMGRIFRE